MDTHLFDINVTAQSLVTALQGKQGVHVAAGVNRTTCTTTDRSVSTWGNGTNEVGSDTLVRTRVRVDLQGRITVQIAAGNGHSMCVTGGD